MMKILPLKPSITIGDLEKLDIRVGRIDIVEDVEGSEKLVRSEGMLFDIGYSNGISPVLSQPENEVPNGAGAG